MLGNYAIVQRVPATDNEFQFVAIPLTLERHDKDNFTYERPITITCGDSVCEIMGYSYDNTPDTIAYVYHPDCRLFFGPMPIDTDKHPFIKG